MASLVFGLALLLAGPISSALAQSVGAEPPALEPQRQGEITFVSGGTGDEDRAAMRQAARDYNLRLQFAIQGTGEYLADVGVTLADASGRTVLDTISDGPLFFARVPPGRYKLTVIESGKSQSRNIAVAAEGALAQSFYWPGGG